MHYDDDFDDFDDDDDDLEFFNVQPGPDTVRLTHRGLDLQQGTQPMVRTLQSPKGVTTFNSPTASLDFRLGQLAEKVAAKVGAGLERYSATTPATPQPFTFKGGVPLADLTEGEAKALSANLQIVGEYVNDIDNQRFVGNTLESFAMNRFVNGPADDSLQLSDDLLSAIRKQSQEFTSHYLQGK